MNGVTIYWGNHLESSTHLNIECDITFKGGCWSIEKCILDHLIDVFWMHFRNQTFLILIDGVPYEWDVCNVK